MGIKDSSATDAFNSAFNSQFKDLDSMFSSPSQDSSLLDSADVKSLIEKLGKQPSKESCTPCATLSKPLSVAGKPGGTMSWILIVLLIVGILLVVFGLFQLFRNSSEQLLF